MASRFRFHGHAFGAGGRINHPFHEFIDVQAASALPEIGGHGFSRSTDFRYRDILRFRHAYSEVTGTHIEGPNGKTTHKSLVRAWVEDLDIMGMVTADRIEVRVSTCAEDEPDGEPCFKFTGSYFENLRVAGVPIKVELAVDVFDECCTHRQAAESYRSKGKFQEHYRNSVPKGDDFKKAPDRVKHCFPQAPAGADLPHVEGLTTLSLVRKLQPERTEFPCWGHVIYIDGFGVISLAQVGIGKHDRHVTMLHVDLGSPIVGAADIVASCGGGAPY